MKKKFLYAGWGDIGIIGLMHLVSNFKYKPEDIEIIEDTLDLSDGKIRILNLAKRFNIKTYYISNKKNLEIKNFDLCISVHWRKKIPYEIIKSCKHGGINLHPSLLPKYAGCSSLAWALLYGEDYVGFTWHSLKSAFDTGDIILQEKIAVKEDDTAFSLWNKVNLSGILNINKAINISLYKKNLLEKQDLNKRTYFKRGFPTFKKAKSLIKGLDKNIYDRAAYFPGRS